MIPQNIKLPDSPQKQVSDLVEKMEKTIGTKEPIEYFSLLTQAVSMLLQQNNLQLDQIKSLRSELNRVKTQSALSIQWEPKVAANMMSNQIDILRNDKDTYFQELEAFKKAYTEDRVTQNYHDFVAFWTTTLGWHPFLE
jgi:hypothetical protein